MDFGKSRIRAARRQKVDERAAAANVKEAQPPQASYSWTQSLVWSVVQVLRHAWLNVYPLIGLAAGVIFVAFIAQTREILGNLEQKGLFLGALAVWAVSIWYTMRVLSTTDFPGDEEAHPAAARCADWLNAESPRIAPFAGLAIIACTCSIFLSEAPSPAWFLVLAAGVVPLAWGVAWVGDRGARLARGALPPRPVYSIGVLVAAAAAGAIGWHAWSSVPQPIRTAPQPLHLEDWLLYACAALTLAPLALRRQGAAANWLMAGALALWLWTVAATYGHHGGSRLPLAILVLAAIGLWLAMRRREVFGIAEDAATLQLEVRRKTFLALGIALALQLALVIAFTNAPIAMGLWMGTLGILFLALSLCACFGIVWVFAPKYVTWPSLAVIPLIWALPLGNAPDHTLRGTSFDPAPAKSRPRLAEHYAAWQAELPKRKDNPVFFVAAAGGGLRAAYWTAHMLAAADDATCGEFGRHVYAYSGVSGGSLGIAAYLAQRQVWAAKSPAERCQPGRRAEMAQMLNRDFLAPVAGSLLFAEMAQRFSPLTYLDDDRGSTLARAWAQAWDDVFPQAKGRFEQPFLEQFAALAPQDGAMPVRPAVFLNATGVHSGRRVIAANVAARVPGSIDLFRPVRGAALKTAGLTLREAVLNSARFTYVSPAATVLACRTPGADGSCPAEHLMLWDRLVDGGYFENSGVATLTDVINLLKPAEGSKQAGLDKSRAYVIVIDNTASNEPVCRPRKVDDDEQITLPPGVPPLSGVTAPIEAFLHVRESRADLEVRRARREFRCAQRLIDWDLFGDRGERNKQQAEEARHEPALGWFVSRRSARSMSDQGAKVAALFPFRLAACDDGKLPKTVRTLVGERTYPNAVCPDLTKP